MRISASVLAILAAVMALAVSSGGRAMDRELKGKT
jgi:hypothetical protein